MRQALPPEVEVSKADWLEARAALATVQPSSTSREPAAAGSLALIPREVPVLPKGYVPRKAILDGIKRNLFSLQAEGAARESATLLVQGMGGSGKTVVASSIARDSEVGAKFDLVCFVGVGQDADLRELQRSSVAIFSPPHHIRGTADLLKFVCTIAAACQFKWRRGFYGSKQVWPVPWMTPAKSVVLWKKSYPGRFFLHNH